MISRGFEGAYIVRLSVTLPRKKGSSLSPKNLNSRFFFLQLLEHFFATCTEDWRLPVSASITIYRFYKSIVFVLCLHYHAICLEHVDEKQAAYSKHSYAAFFVVIRTESAIPSVHCVCVAVHLVDFVNHSKNLLFTVSGIFI